ncbi:MAG: PCRF domain-containing protein, partial [bacterium]|nr:PCRF domain-containing protein [bacterium]
MSKEIKERFNTCKTALSELQKHLELDKKRAQMDKLKNLTQADDFWNDTQKAQETMREFNALKSFWELMDRLDKNMEDVQTILDLMKEEESEELTKEALEKIGL